MTLVRSSIMMPVSFLHVCALGDEVDDIGNRCEDNGD